MIIFIFIWKREWVNELEMEGWLEERIDTFNFPAGMNKVNC